MHPCEQHGSAGVTKTKGEDRDSLSRCTPSGLPETPGAKVTIGDLLSRGGARDCTWLTIMRLVACAALGRSCSSMSSNQPVSSPAFRPNLSDWRVLRHNRDAWYRRGVSRVICAILGTGYAPTPRIWQRASCEETELDRTCVKEKITYKLPMLSNGRASYTNWKTRFNELPAADAS